MKVSSLVGKTLDQFEVKPDQMRPSDTAVGIEVEVENMRGSSCQGLKFWNTTQEGSIVRGCEFVSKPIWGTAITEALDELRELFKKSDPYLSFRTSVHVHLNMLDSEHEHLNQLVLLNLLYEPALFRLHQEWGRYDNIFCVPARKSIKVQDGYAKLLQDLDQGRIRTDYVGYKYSAFNPNALAQFGTIEFRHMGGTADMDEVDQWINVLLQLKLAAVKGTELTDHRKVFGKYHSLLDIHEEDIMDGMQLIDYIQMKRGT